MPEPPVDTRVTETTVEVRSYELDAFDHVNHSVFLNYLEYARYEALRQGGFPYEEMILRGWGVYVVRLEIDYLSQARLGDRLRIRTWAHSRRRSSLVIAQHILREDDAQVEVARALITAVWVDSTRRPMRLPSEVQAALGMS
jgi:acyl-CoA thioester hydrolase